MKDECDFAPLPGVRWKVWLKAQRDGERMDETRGEMQRRGWRKERIDDVGGAKRPLGVTVLNVASWPALGKGRGGQFWIGPRAG